MFNQKDTVRRSIKRFPLLPNKPRCRRATIFPGLRGRKFIARTWVTWKKSSKSKCLLFAVTLFKGLVCCEFYVQVSIVQSNTTDRGKSQLPLQTTEAACKVKQKGQKGFGCSHTLCTCRADLHSLLWDKTRVCRHSNLPPSLIPTGVSSESYRCELRQGSCYQSRLGKVRRLEISALAQSINQTAENHELDF